LCLGACSKESPTSVDEVSQLREEVTRLSNELKDAKSELAEAVQKDSSVEGQASRGRGIRSAPTGVLIDGFADREGPIQETERASAAISSDQNLLYYIYGRYYAPETPVELLVQQLVRDRVSDAKSLAKDGSPRESETAKLADLVTRRAWVVFARLQGASDALNLAALEHGVAVAELRRAFRRLCVLYYKTYENFFEELWQTNAFFSGTVTIYIKKALHDLAKAGLR
jgi:hypothetical protein